MFFSSIKGINKLIIKGMPNTSLKVNIPVQFLGCSNSHTDNTDITEFSNFLLQLKNLRSGSKHA